ncbi:glycosyltransferase [Candidatus Gottesmanbacteria bacterium]|nr:glycosyltransferase [Candidatus Gottesmanbacteria bacterium]
MKISIVLLVKNGLKYLPKLISELGKQSGGFEIELIVVDSGSTDGSWEFIKSLKEKKFKSLKLYKINPKEFGHGKTRNLAVAKCSAEIVVFLSQDALPISNSWLVLLIKPLLLKRHSGESREAGRLQNRFWTSPSTPSLSTPSSRPRGSGPRGQNDKNKIAGVFGRQIPYQKTNLCETFFYRESYPDKRRVMGREDSDKFSNQNLFFSNVNAAARKDLLLKYPFREDLIMSEDQYWGREVLKNGYQIVYEPKAAVYHSHNYNLFELGKRYFKIGFSQKQMGLKGDPMVKGASTFFGLLKYIFSQKPWLLPYAIIYGLVKGGAYFIGRHLYNNF